MATINFTIDDAKLPRVKAGLLFVFPNTEQIPDPGWVDPGDGTVAPLIPKYTDNQWLKERIRRFVVETVKRAESRIAQDLARDALTDPDDTIS